MKFTVDGQDIEIEAQADMPLLWALWDLAGKTGPKFGGSTAQCELFSLDR